jgi:hypothetical protein
MQGKKPTTRVEFPWVGSSRACKYLTRVEVTANSLLRLRIYFGHERLYGTGVCVTNIYTSFNFLILKIFLAFN